MARKPIGIEKKNIRFYQGDIAILQKHFPEIPFTAIVRGLIHKYVKHLENGEIKPINFDPNKLDIE